MTPQISTGETPFKLTYGTKAMIPLDISLPALWTENFDPQQNENQLWANLELLEEAREQASIRMVAYRHKVDKYYNS